MTYVHPSHGRLLGKIYKTEFIKQYNISFNLQESYANEDIGFNNLCKLICLQIYSDNGIQTYLECEEPLIIWTYNPNSITRKNNHEFYFKCNFELSKNIIYAIEEAKIRKVSDD